MMVMNSKKNKDNDKKSKSSSKKSIPDEWKEESKEISQETDKGKRRSLISAIKRSITIKGDKPDVISTDPMNIVITLSPAKHLDIIEYINENVASGGRAEWVRDSIRLKMRIERGVYGLNTGESDDGSKDTEETLQTVFGQFAEVMTKVMTDLKNSQPSYPERGVAPMRERPPSPRVDSTSSLGGPPKLKKIESDDKKLEDLKPDRPSLDDAIGSIIVVE